MTTTTINNKISFEEYLRYDDETNNRYEFVDGELILMTLPTGLHALIIFFIQNALLAEIERLKLPWIILQTVGVRTSINRSRIPDLCIVTREQIERYRNVSAVLETPVLLAVEIVSPESVTRDYRYKRSEYAAIGIAEYWIVDPDEEKVTVLQLVEGFYEEKEYKGSDRIISPTFPELILTSEQIFQV
jgi:Uma2 family endonuclease